MWLSNWLFTVSCKNTVVDYFSPDGWAIHVTINLTRSCLSKINHVFWSSRCVYSSIIFFFIFTTSVHFAASTKDFAGNSSFEVIEERQVTPHGPIARSRTQNRTSFPIHLRLCMSSSATLLKLSRILCSRIGAGQPAVSTSHPATMILAPYSRSVLQASAAAHPGSPNLHAPKAFKLPFFLYLDPQPSKRVSLYDDFDIGGISKRQTPTGHNTFIPDPRCRGWILYPTPLPSLPKPGSCLWGYAWEPFLGTSLETVMAKGQNFCPLR